MRIIPLGGLGEVGKNMTVYEQGEDAIVVDAGLAFPRDEHLGVDLILPDFTYLQQRERPLRAVILTHAHEDHVGSLPYLLREVRVDEELGRIAVPRIVAAYSVGRLMNAKLARSQLIGGLVWGVSMALLEETHVDPRDGRIVNANLAEYHVPVNADVPAIEVAWLEGADPHANPLGVKGIGEIGITGTAAAVANAVYHATGRRVRDLPITLDRLL